MQMQLEALETGKVEYVAGGGGGGGRKGGENTVGKTEAGRGYRGVW